MGNYIAKGSYNIGKNGSATHNDLTAGYQDHIDYSISQKKNKYVVYKNGKPQEITPTEKRGFLYYEFLTYKRLFDDGLQDQKEKYIQSRHKKQAEELDLIKWYNKYSPEEEILQWGNEETPEGDLPDPDVMEKMIRELNEFKAETLKSARGGIISLDFACHYGETTPHVHNRSVYYTLNEEGHMVPGNKKAVLLEAGFLPPDQDYLHDFDRIKDETERKKAIREYERFNNPAVSFEKVCREKWYDILEDYGFAVDREPVEATRDLEDTKANIIKKHMGESAKPVKGDKHKQPKAFKEARKRQVALEVDKMKNEQYESLKVQQTATENARRDARRADRMLTDARRDAREIIDKAKQDADDTFQREYQAKIYDFEQEKQVWEQKQQKWLEKVRDLYSEMLKKNNQIEDDRKRQENDKQLKKFEENSKVLHDMAEDLRRRKVNEQIKIKQQADQAEYELGIDDLKKQKQKDKSK